jgi:sensor histidine kinase regulating citrate/malate metabolism
MVHVQAQADHIQSLTRGKPVNALAELIWNALDADADRIRIGVTDNEIGSPSTIEVSDNGSGISPFRQGSDAIETASASTYVALRREPPTAAVTGLGWETTPFSWPHG